MLELYENIKKFRNAAGMTQSDLADRLGYTDRSSIAKIEKGIVDLPQSKIRQIADVFGVAPGILMGYEDNPDGYMETFSRNLRHFMKTRKLNIFEIAHVTGVEVVDVQHWIDNDDVTGNYMPSDESVDKLAKYLEVDSASLFEDILYLNVKPAQKSELSEKRKQLIDFAMTVPEDKLALILRLAKSVLADE